MSYGARFGAAALIIEKGATKCMERVGIVHGDEPRQYAPIHGQTKADLLSVLGVPSNSPRFAARSRAKARGKAEEQEK